MLRTQKRYSCFPPGQGHGGPFWVLKWSSGAPQLCGGNLPCWISPLVNNWWPKRLPGGGACRQCLPGLLRGCLNAVWDDPCPRPSSLPVHPSELDGPLLMPRALPHFSCCCGLAGSLRRTSTRALSLSLSLSLSVGCCAWQGIWCGRKRQEPRLLGGKCDCFGGELGTTPSSPLPSSEHSWNSMFDTQNPGGRAVLILKRGGGGQAVQCMLLVGLAEGSPVGCAQVLLGRGGEERAAPGVCSQSQHPHLSPWVAQTLWLRKGVPEEGAGCSPRLAEECRSQREAGLAVATVSGEDPRDPDANPHLCLPWKLAG